MDVCCARFVQADTHPTDELAASSNVQILQTMHEMQVRRLPDSPEPPPPPPCEWSTRKALLF